VVVLADVELHPVDRAGEPTALGGVVVADGGSGVGPEVTYADLAGGTYGVRGAIYLGPRQTGLRPYVVTALGVQHWDTGTLDTDVEVLQLALGGGVGWTPGASNTHFGLEARYDFCAQNIDHSEAYTFVSTSAVLRRSW